MTIDEQLTPMLTLSQRNMMTLKDMQLWYLRNYTALEELHYTRDMATAYFLSCIHPRLHEYQLHLNFHRGKK
jgi:hypothetical protein